MHFILKLIYPCVEIRNGKLSYFSDCIPKGFIRDVEEVAKLKNLEHGNIYISGKQQSSKLLISRSLFEAKQRLFNVWGTYKSRFK